MHPWIASFAVGAERWHVSLESIDQFQKEDDWTLCIRDARDRRIVSSTFSLAYLRGKVRRPRLCIGSVQGPDNSMNGRELFRALTKRWYGLRLKMLVIYLAQCIATHTRYPDPPEHLHESDTHKASRFTLSFESIAIFLLTRHATKRHTHSHVDAHLHRHGE